MPQGVREEGGRGMSEHIKNLLTHLKREWVNMPNYKKSWVADSLVELDTKDSEIARLKAEVAHFADIASTQSKARLKQLGYIDHLESENAALREKVDKAIEWMERAHLSYQSEVTIGDLRQIIGGTK
jgi:hypothetical protein